MDAFENDIRYSIEDVGVLDHLNLTLADDWLNTVSVDIPTCLEGSVLIGAYCGKTRPDVDPTITTITTRTTR